MKTRILDLAYPELKELIKSMGEPSFRADQLMRWVYKRLAGSFSEMTDLPEALREKLQVQAILTTLTLLEEKVSADRMTRKALFQLSDGNTVETGYMMYAPAGESQERGTVCVSSQVGCYAACPFCATGQQGFIRNLTSGEIIEQGLYFMRQMTGFEGDSLRKRRPVTNIVFMGMGEPLANYDQVIKAITIFNSKQGLGVGARQLTLSTSGLVPEIRRLAGEQIKVELAVSLHAPNDKLRDYLVPINRKYPLGELIPACREYFEKTGRRPTFEYALFKGVNDSIACARELVNLLEGFNVHVNLIIGNPVEQGEFEPATLKQAQIFNRELKTCGLNSTIRTPRGIDIEAGCGQLRSRYLKSDEK